MLVVEDIGSFEKNCQISIVIMTETTAKERIMLQEIAVCLCKVYEERSCMNAYSATYQIFSDYNDATC
jgi:hypothetical protein